MSDGNHNSRRQFHVRLTDDEFNMLNFLQRKSRVIPLPSLCRTVRSCILKTATDAGYNAASIDEEA